jgi:uncharacterized OB-fold protein
MSAPLDEAKAIHPLRDYQAFLEAGRLMLLRGRSSGKYLFYPRVVEPGDGSLDLEWAEASGKGTVYTVTVVSQRPPKADYNVVLIDLDEGPRMMSRIDGVNPEAVRIGMPVTAKIIRENEAAMVVFEPANVGEAAQ